MKVIDWWYKEWRPYPALSLHVFRASFGLLPTIGAWTCKRRTIGYTFDWLWWSIGYDIDPTCPREWTR